MTRLRARIAIWAARKAGGEFHYAPADEPAVERVSSLRADGTPCRGWPVDLAELQAGPTVPFDRYQTLRPWD